jgi:hypothetical protein
VPHNETILVHRIGPLHWHVSRLKVRKEGRNLVGELIAHFLAESGARGGESSTGKYLNQ